MRVLFVCTANVCRSVSAEVLAKQLVHSWGLTGVELRSAGTAAVEGIPPCTVAPALQASGIEHVSTGLTPEWTNWADLILTAARDNQAAVAAADPDTRTRLFTIRQAGRICEWLTSQRMTEAAYHRARQPQGWGGRFQTGDPRALVAPFPLDNREVDAWFVEEMNAARGLAPLPPEEQSAGPSRRWHRSGQATATSPDDVSDPHTSPGPDLHGIAYEQIRTAIYWLGVALLAVQRTQDLVAAAARTSD